MLSIVSYQNLAGDNPDYLIRNIQAADPEQMEARLAADLAEIVALNATIHNTDDKFTPVDANLAGGGDGHTFIFTTVLARQRLAVVQNVLFGVAQGVAGQVPATPIFGYLPPEFVCVKFGLASQRDAVQSMITRTVERTLDCAFEKLAAVPPQQAPVVPVRAGLTVWQQLQGATQGSRFMFGIAMVPGQFPAPVS